ncbi:MAG: histidinol-phosphate transaminase [Candidatus Omnitrophota bacterium]
MKIKDLIRKNILGITPYVPGKPIEETRREMGLKEIIKLASNENPLGVSPMVISAIKKNIKGLNRYPDSQGFYLKRRLARYWSIDPAGIALGNGSDELIDIIIKTFVEEDENIITADTTFLEYEISSLVNNRKVITAPLRYFKYDLPAIRKRVDKKTKLIFIANPNNPTGTYVTHYELSDFILGLPENVVVVLDEAYDAFIDVNDFPKSQSYLNNKNIIILKTFSKAYGLAGLRLGYCLGKPEFVYYMEKVRQPFNVNSLAQVAAIAALDDRKFFEKTRKAVLEGKRFLYEALSRQGVGYVPSVANFILIDTGRDSAGVFKDMLRFGVIVRDMKQYGLKNFIRVTIGTSRENERFVKVLRKVF